MKYLFYIILTFKISGVVIGQNLDYLNNDYSGHFNEAYGKYDRNKFDIIIPNNDSLHGLIIFIHGGGFRHGDKSAIYNRKDDIKYFIENNIAVATINYRFYSNHDSSGVRVCLHDISRAIQYLRFNANTFNIDKERIGCYGVSAGAGSSLYFAFHDDLALQGDTTLLGESTRIKCAGAIATQSTYNLFKWKRIVPLMRLIVAFKRKQIYNAAANFYGYPEYKSFKNQLQKESESLDMLSMIDSQDPPIYLMNLMKDVFPKNDNVIQHHRRHAIAVSKKLDKFNVDRYLYTSKNVNTEKDIDLTMREFIVKYLNN